MDTVFWYMIYDNFGMDGFILTMCAGIVFIAIIWFMVWNRFR